MLKNLIVRITGLATAVFVALLVSAQSALAILLPDPGVVDGNVSTAAPSSGFDVLAQPWLVPLVVVIVGLVVVALSVVVVRRRHRMARVLPA